MTKSQKLLISTPMCGGVGGLERNIYEVCKAFSDFEIDVYSNSIIKNGFLPKGKNVKLFDLLKCIEANDFKEKKYDVYLQYRTAGTFFLPGKYFQADLKLVNPSGNPVGNIEERFDFVANQAEDGIKYVKDKKKHVVLPSPVTKLTNKSKKVNDLPEKYFLTIFNPYVLNRNYDDGFKPYKGYDILYDVSDKIKYPIVWCYSEITSGGRFNIINKKNVILKKNLSQEEIAYLYKNCLGYICFSREEGFGWSLADALLYGIPIYSRNIGVLTLFEKVDGINIYKNKKVLIKLLNGAEYKKRIFDCSVLKPENYRNKVLSLLKDARAK